MTRMFYCVRIGLFLSLFVILSAGLQAAPINKDLTGTRLAAVEVSSKLDLLALDEVGGIIDNVSGLSAQVYLTEAAFNELRTRGLDVRWILDLAKQTGQELWDRTRDTRNPLDDYHTNDEIRMVFANWQSLYPEYFKYDSIGMSVQGRPLFVCKLSDNVTVDEAEIEVKYVANMHGDEVVGKENCLRFIEEILTGYGMDPELTQLMEEFEMWFLPCMNPDGLSLAQRANANGVDLNRDFPDQCDDSVNTTAGRQIETAHVMNWTAQHNFVVSANFHGGALVVNYPWDNGCDTPNYTYAACPDDALFIWISERYTQYNTRMWNSSEFYHGITNGAEWYEASGAMQDWNYVWMGDREVTIELDNTKWPAASRLESLWQENRLAMRYYWLEAQYGVRGITTDSLTGDPLRASIKEGTNVYPSYSSALHGDYYRMLRPGTYNLTFSAPGYNTKTISGVSVVGTTPTVLNVQLSRIPSAEIAVSPAAIEETVPICDITEIPFTVINDGDSALIWSAAEGLVQETGYGSITGGGYRYIDSDQSGGPDYAWRDISTDGTIITFSSDDQNLGPYSIGFTFPFFGTNFTQYRLSANGWISFTSTSTAYSNRSLPSSDAPENLIAAWWDDLSPHRSGTSVRRYNTADSLIISFNNVQSYADNGLYNFQFILLSSGKIVFQYANMGTNRLNSSTIGIQNSARTKGAAVIYNQYYIHNNMAIEFCPHSAVELVPASGTVSPNNSSLILARINSCCLRDGETVTELLISSNDPITATLTVPVTLTVTEILPPEPVNDLTIISDGSTVTLNWSAAVNATGYYVYRLTAADQDISAGELLTPTPVTETTYSEMVAETEATYFYQVVSTR